MTDKRNVERRKYRNEAKKDGRPFMPNRCVPLVNREAAMTPAVQEFADKYGLPRPAVEVS